MAGKIYYDDGSLLLELKNLKGSELIYDRDKNIKFEVEKNGELNSIYKY